MAVQELLLDNLRWVRFASFDLAVQAAPFLLFWQSLRHIVRVLLCAQCHARAQESFLGKDRVVRTQSSAAFH